jgi:hypothetical protein
MQEFLNFKNLQFVKNTTFSKFSQNLNFYFRDLRPEKKRLESNNPWSLPFAGWQILTQKQN